MDCSCTTTSTGYATPRPTSTLHRTAPRGHVAGRGRCPSDFANIVHDLVLLHSLGRASGAGARLAPADRGAPRRAAAWTPHYHRDLRITDAPTLECVIDAVGRLRIAIEAGSVDGHGRLADAGFAPAPDRAATSSLPGRSAWSTGSTTTILAKCAALTARASVASSTSAASYCCRRWAIRPPGKSSTWPARTSPPRAAIDLGADKLLLFCAEGGLLDEQGKLVRELRPQQVPAHLARLGSNYQGELLDAAAEACRAASNAAISSAMPPMAHCSASCSPALATVRWSAQEQFESLREATIEDVGGLIELISPLEEQGILVRRSREVLEREIEQFSIVEREGLIIACCGALSPSPIPTAVSWPVWRSIPNTVTAVAATHCSSGSRPGRGRRGSRPCSCSPRVPRTGSASAVSSRAVWSACRPRGRRCTTTSATRRYSRRRCKRGV